MEPRYEDALDLAARKLRRAIPLAAREPAIPTAARGRASRPRPTTATAGGPRASGPR